MTSRRSADRSLFSTCQASVEGLAHRCQTLPPTDAVRVPGSRQYVDTTIGGYSPSLTSPTLVADRRERPRVRASGLRGGHAVVRGREPPSSGRGAARVVRALLAQQRAQRVQGVGVGAATPAIFALCVELAPRCQVCSALPQVSIVL